MRVVFLGHTSVLSGGELAFATLLPALAERGVEPLVLLAEDGPLVGRLTDAGIEVDVVPLDAGARTVRREQLGRLPGRAAVATGRYSVRVARRIIAERADLVHTFSLKAALYGGVAGRLARRPVVWSIQDRIASDYLPAPAVAAVRTAARVLPTTIIANSRTTASALLGAGPAPIVIPPACLVGEPLPPPPAEPFTVGIIGRISPWKGQDVFLRAFAAAFPGGTGLEPARARIIGGVLFDEHDHESALRTLTRDLGLEERVDFRGFRDDVPAELAALHAVVHASTVPEPFGMVVVEAMAAGRPVVAAGLGGPTEVVTDGVDGLLVPPGDVDALAEALRRLHDDDAFRARLAAAGPVTAAAYGPGPAATATCGVYEGLVD